jgi:hypothetical protein
MSNLFHVFLQAEEDLLGTIFVVVFVVIILIAVLLLVISLWKIFTKAGKPGWAVLIPIYNLIVLFQIIGRPWWYIFFMLIPGAQIVLWGIIAINLARIFDKNWAFGIGIFLLPFLFLPILGLGKAAYNGPDYRM